MSNPYVLLGLAAFALWVLTSFVVTITLPALVKQDTWHLRLMRHLRDEGFMPISRCQYFWSLLVTPPQVLIMWALVGIVWLIVIGCRLCHDVIVKPLHGEYTVGMATKKYWKKLTDTSGRTLERYGVEYADMPGKHISFATIIILALLGWAFVGYTSWGCLANEVCKTQYPGLALIETLWTVVSVIVTAVIVIVLAYVGFSEAKDILAQNGMWEMLKGKFCPTLRYEDSHWRGGKSWETSDE